MKPHRLVIVGAGGFGRELLDWADQAVGASWSEVVWVDDNAAALDGFGYPQKHLAALSTYAPAAGDLCVVAIGSPATRQRVVEDLQSRGASFTTLRHPSSVVSATAQIGNGCVLCPLSFVSANAMLKDFVHVNALSSVGHDARVGAYSTLSAHVDLTGGVTTGARAFFGSGARAIPGIRIGQDAVVGAGATVMRHVQDGVTVYAQPARKL
jgi:sugar O-acyltransferase (sialic acid O-acetyltransferase NeuD family)